jgi:ankyrin repeat/BTB/POZ domain-containing protein 1
MLIIVKASLCGHFEVVQLLLESGALCERDTFQGERCLYNALNDRIRNLLLEYDFSKSTNPLQPLAAHITSLLSREHPRTWDLSLIWDHETVHVHKFLLAARSPYFARKLESTPEITSWRLPNSIPLDSIYTTVQFLYFSEVAADLGDDLEEQEILTGIDKFSRQVEVDRLFEFALNRDDRRLTRQRMTDELTRGRDEVSDWFQRSVIKNKITIETSKASEVKWDRSNAIFADVILQADEISEELEDIATDAEGAVSNSISISVLPIGPFGPNSEQNQIAASKTMTRKSVLFPVHKAMLIRSEFFLLMFSSAFREAQDTQHLQIVSIDCPPDVLEIVLKYLYTEDSNFPLDVALEVLFAADLLLLDKLKVKAATTISSLASGASVVEAENSRGETDLEELIDIYDVIRAGWTVRVQRLEEFGARYIANRLERFIDDPEFAQLVKESAQRVQKRQETDTIELVDDIRYYLSDRFRLRMEDIGLEEMEGDLDDQTLADNLDGLIIEDGKQPETIQAGVIRTLDGEIVEDEFDQDARNYQILMDKIDDLLERLKLDA